MYPEKVAIRFYKSQWRFCYLLAVHELTPAHFHTYNLAKLEVTWHPFIYDMTAVDPNSRCKQHRKPNKLVSPQNGCQVRS